MNTLPIITADERLTSKKGITLAIFGETGIGKTSLLNTLHENTLCLDMEAGLLAVPTWRGDALDIRTWEIARDIACLIGGVNPTSKDPNAYSQQHFMRAKARYGDADQFDRYACLFIDSLTVASRLCLQWCKAHLGHADLRAVYGLMAHEMMLWLNQFQRLKDKDAIFVGILEKRTNEFRQVSWGLQIEGSKLGLELPGIVDEVLCLVMDPTKKSPLSHTQEPPRVFICRATNLYGYPAKDRSGKLAMAEEANLTHILAKIKGALPGGQAHALSLLPSQPPTGKESHHDDL